MTAVAVAGGAAWVGTEARRGAEQSGTADAGRGGSDKPVVETVKDAHRLRGALFGMTISVAPASDPKKMLITVVRGDGNPPARWAVLDKKGNTRKLSNVKPTSGETAIPPADQKPLEFGVAACSEAGESIDGTRWYSVKQSTAGLQLEQIDGDDLSIIGLYADKTHAKSPDDCR